MPGSTNTPFFLVSRTAISPSADTSTSPRLLGFDLNRQTSGHIKNWIDGVAVKQLKVIPDERGRLMEILRADDEARQAMGPPGPLYYRRMDAALHPAIERQLGTAASLLASIWYTACENGQPAPP